MHHAPSAMLAILMALAAFAAQAQGTSGSAVPSRGPAARPSTAPAANAPAPAPIQPCTGVVSDTPAQLVLGKSQIVRLPFPVARLIIGGRPGGRAGSTAAAETMAPAGRDATTMQRPTVGEGADGVAETDVTLLGPTELFFLPRRTGTMNVVLQANDGRCLSKDLVVTVDPTSLQAKLTDLMPQESGIRVRAADDALVLTGTVSDTTVLDQVLGLAGSHGDSRKVVNLLRVTAPQQVMLEVQIAEVSKSLLDRFGLDFSRMVTSADGVRTSIISGLVGGAAGVVGRFGPNVAGGSISGSAASSVSGGNSVANSVVTTGSRGSSLLGLDLQKRDGLVRVLAEPNIMAISGQSASFLSGGKIFIPVAQTNLGGTSTITLEEKEFGVGIKFTPTVLGGRINLKLVSEVSELSQTGTPFTTVGGVTAVLPSLTTRRVDTTVQLGDGQSFAVAGLIRHNVTEALNKVPGLGEVPVMGALFRSTEFQNDQTELMFVVTPRLVRPFVAPVALPTDNHVVPTSTDVILHGRAEGTAPAPKPVAARTSLAPAAPAAPVPAPAPLPAPAPVPVVAPAAVIAPVARVEPITPVALPVLRATPALPAAPEAPPAPAVTAPVAPAEPVTTVAPAEPAPAPISEAPAAIQPQVAEPAPVAEPAAAVPVAEDAPLEAIDPTPPEELAQAQP
jgi:pilus assembly protein CpaC